MLAISQTGKICHFFAIFCHWWLIMPVYNGSIHNVPLCTGTGAFAFLFVWPYKILGVVSYGRK